MVNNWFTETKDKSRLLSCQQDFNLLFLKDYQMWSQRRDYPIAHLCAHLIEKYFTAVASGHDKPLSPPLLMITMQLTGHYSLPSAAGRSLFGKGLQDEE